jgi:hypothetical protein
MSDRPFEEGDLIITIHHKRLIIVEITKDHIETRMEKRAYGYHYFDLMGKPKPGSKTLGKSKVIRKQRKGNAESRGIVAMLAREYHSIKHRICDEYRDGPIDTLESVYKIAKTMLI